MIDPYSGREQTKAKHFILRRYLQALAFKILNFSDITYVDGFSGPWKSQTEDFSDSSFMIAISVLRDAQAKMEKRKKVRQRIRCFLAEKDKKAFAQLENAVQQFHQPEKRFEVTTYCGEFEDAVDPIQASIGNSFALIFIDPKGWTGYALPKIEPLFMRRKCEVLVTFMYSFINRFAQHQTQENINSLAPILGGPDLPARLDANLRVGLAVEKLFRETLK